MTFSNPAGWRERVKKARERQAARDDAADVRQERARLYAAAAAESARQAAANEARARAERLTCPCCNGDGKLTVEAAERIYRALELLPSHSRPDPVVIATLATIARGEAVHRLGPKISQGTSHPRGPDADLGPMHVPADAQKRNKTLNISRLGDSDYTPDDTPDGALIEP